MSGNLDLPRRRLAGVKTILIPMTLVLAGCGAEVRQEFQQIAPVVESAPAPGDGAAGLDNPLPAGWSDGPIFLDSSELVVAESFPLQVSIKISADLPTPCDEPFWKIADDGTTLDVTIFTGVDPAQTCIQMIQPIEFSIDLGSWDEPREVLLNGEPLGGF